jgi:hypothetical protein
MSTQDTSLRADIRDEITGIAPFDAAEEAVIKDVVAWLDSGAEIVRRAKPATPPKHLVSYFLLVDGDHILLVDHRTSGLWLPSGGHVEPGEHPRATVEREVIEELSSAYPPISCILSRNSSPQPRPWAAHRAMLTFRFGIFCAATATNRWRLTTRSSPRCAGSTAATRQSSDASPSLTGFSTNLAS